jgi:uncharacterized membrane protein YkvA (DUF1232 family)
VLRTLDKHTPSWYNRPATYVVNEAPANQRRPRAWQEVSMSEDKSREQQFYQRLRKTVKLWAGSEKGSGSQFTDLILAGPDLFMLLVRLSQDDRVDQASRTKLVSAAAYFISPLDLIPELILGPPGLVDDIALSAFVLNDVLESTDPAVVREHWEGDTDLLELIRQILAVADTMVGGPIWRRLIARAQSFVPTK